MNKMMRVFGGPALLGMLCCAAPAHADVENNPTTMTETKTKKKVKSNGDVETKTKTKTVTKAGTETETSKTETSKTETRAGVAAEEMGDGAKRKHHVKRATDTDTKTAETDSRAVVKTDTKTDTRTTDTKVTDSRVTAAKPLAADNTGKNDPDRSRVGEKPTADQAKNNRSDVDIMAQIRREVMAEKGLSTSAHNVKIVAESGLVTLKGPVKSVEEKALVAQKAVSVVGVKNVRNELEIAP